MKVYLIILAMIFWLVAFDASVRYRKTREWFYRYACPFFALSAIAIGLFVYLHP